ncbi:MAG TPA: hypothetical protein VE999_01590 [Gemmataceae bacterium]|nr:hypothetical protein [Bryobacteraceae bacterium]HZV03758.1 hypothetical protein [Gemmataceae bacterium]
MARTVEQIQADIDTLHAALGHSEKVIVFPDGRRIEYLNTDDKLKAIAALEEEKRNASGGSGGRVRFAQHKRGDGPTGPTLYDRPGLW